MHHSHLIEIRGKSYRLHEHSMSAPARRVKAPAWLIIYLDFKDRRCEVKQPELYLPQELLQRATLSGKEHAWRIGDVPSVIAATRDAGLISIGGQLQFILPDIGACECYWVEVDTYKSVPTSLPWTERVEQTAATALSDFAQLSSRFDFLAEGRRSFAESFKKIERRGGDPAQFMWFVWYVAQPGWETYSRAVVYGEAPPDGGADGDGSR